MKIKSEIKHENPQLKIEDEKIKRKILIIVEFTFFVYFKRFWLYCEYSIEMFHFLLLLFLFLGVVSQYSGGTSMGGYGGSAQGGYGGGGYGGGSTGGGYGGGYDSSYGQGSGVYFKKPVPIDEKPIFFRTPYWLPNMYYGHYG